MTGKRPTKKGPEASGPSSDPWEIKSVGVLDREFRTFVEDHVSDSPWVRNERRRARIYSWAARQHPDALAVHFAGVFRLYQLERNHGRALTKLVNALTDNESELGDEIVALRCDVDDLLGDLSAYRRDRSKGADKRWANDPKKAAKAAALQLWKERHAGHHPELRTVEQFAIEVMRRWPVLTSAKTIAAWSAAWTKQVRDGVTPSC